jgi:hypothetical protein
MSRKVFISYSRKDFSFTKRLVDDLLAQGIPAWLDQIEIKTGQKWDSAIQNALSTCEYLLVVLSPNSVTSENVLDEVAYAVSKKRPIFPVLYQDCELPYRLARVQHIDFRSKYEDGLRNLVVQLKEKGILIQAQATGEQESSASQQARSSEPSVERNPIYTPFHSLLYERRTPLEASQEGIVLRGPVYINGKEPRENFHLANGSLLITDVPIDNRFTVEALLKKLKPYFDSFVKEVFIIITPSISKSILDYFDTRMTSVRICSISIGGMTQHMKRILQDLATITRAIMITGDFRGNLKEELDSGLLMIDSSTSERLFEFSGTDLGSFQEVIGNANRLMFRADPHVAGEIFQDRWQHLERALEHKDYKADYVLTLDRMIRLAGSLGEDRSDWLSSKHLKDLSLEVKDIDALPIFHPPLFNLDRTSSSILGRGYASPYFITDADTDTAVVERPDLILFAGHLDIYPLIPLLDSYITVTGKRDYVIISYTASDSLIATLNISKLRGLMNVLLVTLEPISNDSRQKFQALAKLIGARLCQTDEDLSSLFAGELDSVNLVSATEYETVITIS